MRSLLLGALIGIVLALVAVQFLYHPWGAVSDLDRFDTAVRFCESIDGVYDYEDDTCIGMDFSIDIPEGL